MEDVTVRYPYRLDVEAGEVKDIGIPLIPAIPGEPPVLAPFGGVPGLYACSQPPHPVPVAQPGPV